MVHQWIRLEPGQLRANARGFQSEDAPLAPAEAPLKEGVGQREELDKDNKSTRDSDTVLMGDAPP